MVRGNQESGQGSRTRGADKRHATEYRRQGRSTIRVRIRINGASYLPAEQNTGARSTSRGGPKYLNTLRAASVRCN